MAPSFWLNRVRQLGVLAVVLAAVLFIAGGRAEAAPHHGAHQAQIQPQAHGAHHQAQPAPAADHHRQGKGGMHHDGGCHCMSASCVPALPVSVSDLRVHLPRLRHAAPAAQSAMALAGVDPPAEPPRM